MVDDALLELAQEHFAIEFPTDLVDFLKSDDFEREQTEGVWTTLHDVVEGEQWALQFMTRGVERGFWSLSLSSRPATAERAIEIFVAALANSPRLIPLYSNRYAIVLARGTVIVSVHRGRRPRLKTAPFMEQPSLTLLI